jgi:hypothetical protein
VPAATGSHKVEHLRARLVRSLAAAQPRSAEALWHFVRAAHGLAVPRRAVCPGHVAPMEYLTRAILEPGHDLVVWASRGGAKTELGSVAAHLDAILRPGCQTRILGGSLDQSEKMYAYLTAKWAGPWAALLARDPTARRTDLVNGSAIEILTQSSRSVRGQRVHRLKCDEVDEFSPEVWQAAQFITQSAPGLPAPPARAGRNGRAAWRGEPSAWIPAQLEVFSTLHRPAGPMATLVDRLTECGMRSAECGMENDKGNGNRNDCGKGRGGEEKGLFTPHSALRIPHSPLLLKWCLWEVIEPCPPQRSCSRCPLWSDCEGKAREADGYFPIDDAIAQKARASCEAWETEMLCHRPRADGRVFRDFDPARHVAPVAYDPLLPLYRALDFGYANPFVCLWVQVKGDGTSAGRVPSPGRSPLADADLSATQFRVVAEYVARERPIAEHAREMAARDPGPVLATFADPAGWQRTDVTGTGPCQELAALGLRVRTPHAGILEGVELVRRLLKGRGAAAGPGLVVDPSCRWLIRSMQEYHWDQRQGQVSERPAKDGADHPIDALRYLVTGLCLARGRLRVRRW